MQFRITAEDVDALAALPEQSPTPGSDQTYCNPPTKLYKRYNFLDLHEAYRDAADFLNYLLSREEAPPRRLLDFGCGWGRMLRLLRRSEFLADTEMHGCDIDANGLEFIRQTVPRVQVLKHGSFPPLVHADQSFDLIYSFSVFSHLSPECHLAWAKELRRIAVPGGTVCVTTQGIKFLQWCAKNPDEPLPKSVPNFAKREAVEQYLDGVFLYEVHSPHAPDYGHAAVPRNYFEANWEPLGFKIVDWDESHSQVRCLLKAE